MIRRSLQVFRQAGFLDPRAPAAIGAGLLAHREGIGAVLRYAAHRHTVATALVDDSETITYAALAQQVSASSSAFRTAVTRGERVGVLLHNDVRSVHALLTAACLGLSVWPLDARGPGPSVASVAADHDLSLLLGVDPPAGLGETVRSADGMRLVRRSPAPTHPDRRRLVVLTGGTTGVPKAAGRRASASSMWAPFHSLVHDVGLRHGGSAYLTTPLHHGFGLSALLLGMVLGTRAHLTGRFDAETVAHAIRTRRPETLVIVPTVLQRLLAHDVHALDAVRTVVSGSAPLPEALAETVRTCTDARLFHLFGTSEAGFSALATPGMLRDRPGTIGRAIPGVRLRVVDAALTEVGAGITGALQMRGGAATARGWVDTGDLAHRDEVGLLHLDGRSDEVIQSGGVSVAPAELERVLCAHPAIEDSAVVPVPDPDLGQRLTAFVVSRPGHQLDVEGLHDWLRGQVAHALRPRWIRTLPELPLTPVLKVDRQKLKNIAQQLD